MSHATILQSPHCFCSSHIIYENLGNNFDNSQHLPRCSSQRSRCVPSNTIWVNHNDLTVLPRWKKLDYFREIIPFYGPTIQVSEIFQFTQTYPHCQCIVFQLDKYTIDIQKSYPPVSSNIACWKMDHLVIGDVPS